MSPLEHVKPGSLAIGYIHGGTVHDVFFQSALRFMELDLQNLRLLNSWNTAKGPFHADNRNNVVRMVLEKEHAEWLLFIDTDIEWEPEHPYMLLALANATTHRIITGMYFSRPGLEASWMPVWFDFDHKQEFVITSTLNGDPLQPLAGCGMGICLIHRSVLTEFPDLGHNQRWFGHDLWHIDGERAFLGEDLTFCLRAHQLGIPIWGHRNVIVKHHKETVIGRDEFLAQATVVRQGLDHERIGVMAK